MLRSHLLRKKTPAPKRSIPVLVGWGFVLPSMIAVISDELHRCNPVLGVRQFCR
jgi:hypothetical protein